MEAGVVLVTLDDGLLGVLKEVHKVGVRLHECVSLTTKGINTQLYHTTTKIQTTKANTNEYLSLSPLALTHTQTQVHTHIHTNMHTHTNTPHPLPPQATYVFEDDDPHTGTLGPPTQTHTSLPPTQASSDIRV